MRLKDFKLDAIIENTHDGCVQLNFIIGISCCVDALSDYFEILDTPYRVILVDAYKIAVEPELFNYFVRVGKIENNWRD